MWSVVSCPLYVADNELAEDVALKPGDEKTTDNGQRTTDY